MKTNDPGRDERAIIDHRLSAHEVPRKQPRAGVVAGIALTMAAVLGGCSSGALSSGSLAIPSIDASAAASAGAQIVSRVLDQVDAAIADNETSGRLSADTAAALKELTASMRTSLQSGDVAAAKTAFTQFAAKVDEFASDLTDDAGTKLRDAVAALKAAVGS